MLKEYTFEDAVKFGEVHNIIMPLLQKLDPDIDVTTTHSIHRVETVVTLGDGHTITIVDEETDDNLPDFFYTEAMSLAKALEYLLNKK